MHSFWISEHDIILAVFDILTSIGRNIIYTVYVEIKYLLYENTFEQFIMVRYFGVTTQTNLYKNQCINTFNDMYVYQRGRCH